MAYRRLQHGLVWTISSIALLFTLLSSDGCCCWGFQTSSMAAIGRNSPLRHPRRINNDNGDSASSLSSSSYPTPFQTNSGSLRTIGQLPEMIGKRGAYYQLQSLAHSRDYMRQLERQSGKDYRWIKPLTKPVSRLMMYVTLIAELLEIRIPMLVQLYSHNQIRIVPPYLMIFIFVSSVTCFALVVCCHGIQIFVTLII